MAMKEKLPLISVLICNYNYSKYIREALDSVLAQTYENIEIVVIDDGSSDDSVRVVEQYIKDHPDVDITMKAKKKNEGLCYARNDALATAKGEYLLFLDSDDAMPRDYISSLYGVAKQTNADVVYGDVETFDGENEKSNAPEYSQDELLLHNYINISSLMKRDSVKGHKFDVFLNRKSHEDYDFWLGLSLAGLNFTKAHNIYLNYRIQELSRNNNTQDIEQRLTALARMWRYSMNKYKDKYPDKITDDLVFNFVDAHISHISNLAKELGELNETVQKQLLPELDKRDKHITQVTNRLEQQYHRNDQLLKSSEYRIGRLILLPLRIIKRVFRRDG